jgi:hypothetical protein
MPRKRKRGVGTKLLKLTKRMVGRSKKSLDRSRKALRPGKRKTAWGTTYWETRANRSDWDRRRRL